MTDEIDNQEEYEYLKKIIPTQKQIRHLRDDLFYDGPEPTDAYEASILISILHSNQMVQARRMYETRIKEGPSWMIWEKCMFSSRKDYDKQQWENWWTETRSLALEAGLIPAKTPQLPSRLEGGSYSTAQELINEIRELLGAPKEEVIQIDMSVSSIEEAIAAKQKIGNMLEDLRTVDEDAAWTISRIREAVYGDSVIGKLYEDNVGGKWRGVILNKDQFRLMKQNLVKLYTHVRVMIKSLKSQMRSFIKKINNKYKKKN
jgi:hypothetical protein